MVNPDVRHRLENVVISPSASIIKALERMDKAGTGALVLCSKGWKLKGLLTDGDIRKAIMHGVSLETEGAIIATSKPLTAPSCITAGEAVHLMNQHDINHLPVVDEEGQLQDFLLRKDLFADKVRKNAARKRVNSVIIFPTTSIAEAIAQLDKAGTGALVLCSSGRKLHGLLTDGDIRRAILHGVSLENMCESIASRSPVTAPDSASAEEELYLINKNDINHLPVVDAEGNIVEFLLRKDFVREEQLSLSAVIMAGGYGKRLQPLTEKIPKPMLPLGDRPLLERTIHQLRRSGIRDVSLTTHYLPDNIERYFGHGEEFGVNLN